jgi:predicted DNA-binding WGR domain protein
MTTGATSAPAGIERLYAWFYEYVEPGAHDKFYHIYLAELAGGEARIALHWGANRTNGQRPKTEHFATVAAARREVDKVRRVRDDHRYTLLDEGVMEPDPQVIRLLGLTGVTAGGATDPFERHEALSLRCMRLLTGDVSTQHIQVMRELRELQAELDEAMAQLHARQRTVEARYATVLKAG